MKINLKLKNKEINILKNNKLIYYLLFLAMVFLSVINLRSNILLNNKLDEEAFIVFNNEEKNDIEYQDDNSNNRDTRFIDKENTINVDNDNEYINYNNKYNDYEKKYDYSKKVLEFIKPLNGKVIKNYSENLVYSKTLDLWKIHQGVDILGNLNDKIISVEDGVIERKFEDSFYGNTVIIKHENGYKSIYSNVSSNLNINEKVLKYQKIGVLDNSGIGEFKDEYHLHFMMIYNDKIIDPNKKIKF